MSWVMHVADWYGALDFAAGVQQQLVGGQEAVHCLKGLQTQSLLCCVYVQHLSNCVLQGHYALPYAVRAACIALCCSVLCDATVHWHQNHIP